MSIKSAFAFIQRIRSDDRLRRQLDRSNGLAGVVDLAGRVGYRFSEEDLRVAFARDSAMRSWFYSGRAEDAPSD